MNLPIIWQRIEGAIIFLAALYAYWVLDYNLVLFIVLLFSVDATMIGYFINNTVGAHIYNLGHSFALPVLLMVAAHVSGNPLLFALGLIWIAHCGLDRVLGYGLKFPSCVKDTHLGRIGQK